MKYEVIEDVPLLYKKMDIVEETNGLIRLQLFGTPVVINPLSYPHLFRPIKPKRVLVVEYEIVNDDISFDASRILVSETGASRYLKSYPKDCRIEERY